MVVNLTKISQKMNKLNWLSKEKKKLQNENKSVKIIIRKYFNLEKFASL